MQRYRRSQPANKIDEAVKATLIDALEKHKWVQSAAARFLGITPMRMHRLVIAYGVMKPGDATVRRLVKA